MPDAAPIGVLLMAYGGPESLADLPGYLADIRSGRPTPRTVLEEISRNYAAIGGRSPLLERTKEQGAALARALDDASPRQFRVYLGMRHWAPWIEDAVGNMIDDGITRAISLVLAPQFSGMSVARYQQRIDDGMSFHRGMIDIAHVASYHDAPGLINALAQRVAEGLQLFPDAERPGVHVVFSAHSLPARIKAAGDPYDTQARETARLVAVQAGLPESRWSWSYQSAGRTGEEWLGPTLPEHLQSLADLGVRRVLSIPVGFVSDHVEILYDIDIDAKRVAESLGMSLKRPPALNDDPAFIGELALIIARRAKEECWA